MATRRTYRLSPVTGKTDTWRLSGGGGGGTPPIGGSHPDVKGFRNAVAAIANLVDGPFERFDNERPTTLSFRIDLVETS